MILFVQSNKLTTAASAIFLQATAPLWVVLLSPWLLGERIRARDLVYMAVLAVGLGCFFVGIDPVSATAPNPLARQYAGRLVRAHLGADHHGAAGARPQAARREAGGRPRRSGGASSPALGCLPMALPVVGPSRRPTG